MFAWIFGLLAFALLISLMWHRDEIAMVRRRREDAYYAHRVLLNTIDAGTMPMAVIASRGWKIDHTDGYFDADDPNKLTSRHWTVNGETDKTLIGAYNKACRVYDARTTNSEDVAS
jgi:hypothetical protein